MRLQSPRTPTLAQLLTPEVVAKGVSGRLAVMQRLSLTPRILPVPQYTLTSRGSAATETGTAGDYASRWSHFHKFCVVLGLYDSCILLDRPLCPDRPIPVTPQSCSLYMQYMCCSKSTELTCTVTQVPIRDVSGNPVYCTNTWKAPGNLCKFLASMNALHELYPVLQGPYIEACSSCLECTRRNAARALYTPCVIHTEGARISTKGNVTLSKPFLSYLKANRELLKEYSKKGNIQLLPSQVHQIRVALLAENSLSGLQFWTMILLGIKLFLRITELLTLKVEDFDPELMMLESTNCFASALAVRILGKGNKYAWLSLYCDDKFPELCPVRALLLYISMTGIRSGFIFPQQLTPPTGVCTQHYPYGLFLKRMKYLVTVNVGRQLGPQDIFGTHILRKTAYLFAIFSCLLRQSGPVVNLHELLLTGIMESARHACIKNVRYYSKDAMTRYEWDRAKATPSETQLGEWRSIHMEDINAFKDLTRNNRLMCAPLPDIAKVYLETYLGFSVHISVAAAVEKAFSKKANSPLTDSTADCFARTKLSANDYDDYLTHRRNDDENRATGTSVEVAVLPNDTAPREDSVLTTTTTTTSRVDGRYENSMRRQLAKNTVPEKIRIFGEMYQSDKGLSTKTFSPSYRALYYAKVKPVGLCLVKCFDGDVHQFAERLNKLPNKGMYVCCSVIKHC
jgi:integrase